MQDCCSTHKDRKESPHLIMMKKLLPGVVLIFALAVDQTSVLGVSLIPLACVISMVYFAFVLPSREMIGWTIIYMIVIVTTLWLKRDMWGGGSGDVEALVATRALVAASAGVLACLFARRRERETDTQKAIYLLLDQMNIPVITSNQDGWLLHVNPEARKLLGDKLTLHTPFFELFAASSAKGVAIRNYVDLATGVADGPVPMDLALSPDRSQVHSAIMLRVDVGDYQQVMTTLSPQRTDLKLTQTIPNE